MVMHLLQEPDHVIGACIMVQEVIVQTKPFSPRSTGERRHRRDTVMAIPRILNRRLPTRSPDAASQRLQQEPALIEKHQASLLFEALFLAAATRRGANGQWPARCVRGRAVRASGHSNPACVAASPHNRRDTAHQTDGGLHRARAVRSTRLARSPSKKCPVATQSVVAAAAGDSISAWNRDSVWGGVPPRLSPSKPDSSGWQTICCSRPWQPLPSTISPAQKAGLLSFDELPAPRGSLKVSFIYYDCPPGWVPLTG